MQERQGVEISFEKWVKQNLKKNKIYIAGATFKRLQ